jgi:hypothetical protein
LLIGLDLVAPLAGFTALPALFFHASILFFL